ncbi:lysophospholipid acyltransferase family protein [Streptomyces sp. NPDC035033]|uniref:lysophospholipid acyltransferase family protein n=1 Tax=Streptomyces sp. NPDC035033 TaxID=3155368 RepID=UPI0033CA291E
MNGAVPAPSPWLPTAPCTPGRHCAAHPDPGPAPAPEAPEGAAEGAAEGAVGRAARAALRPALVPVPLACVRLAAGVAAVLLGVLLLPVAALLPAAARLALVRLWVRAVVRAFGVRPAVTGGRVPAGRPLLVVANHVSWLDIPLVAAVLPGRMVAKREVRGWPVLGALAALGGTVFLDRDGLRRLPGTVREVAGVLAAGGRVTAFPEGSTWCGRAGGRFRPALFQAAVDTGSDVQPVRIGYRPTGAAAYVGEDPLGASLWRVARTRGLTAEIRILDPISVIQYPDRRLLAAAAYRAVASDSANRPPSSVHHRTSSSPASASSARTPS